MPITKHQLKLRDDPTTIGSSDVPRILNLVPWGNEHDVYLEKTGRVPPSFEVTPSMEAGNFLEAGILDWAQTKLGKITRNQRRVNREIGLAVNVDALVDETKNPVEVKHFIHRREEGDELPDYVIAQVHAHMVVLGVDHGWVPHTEGGILKMAEVYYDEELGDYILERLELFWERVREGVAPPDIECGWDSLKRIKRSNVVQVELDRGVWDSWQLIMQQAKGISDAKAELRDRVVRAMEDGEEAVTNGELAFSFRAQKGRPSVDFDALRRDGLYDKYVTPGEDIRVFRAHKLKQPALPAEGVSDDTGTIPALSECTGTPTAGTNGGFGEPAEGFGRDQDGERLDHGDGGEPSSESRDDAGGHQEPAGNV
jgi:predicted phage-related endonuclease